MVLGKITDSYTLSTYNGLFIHGNTTTTRLCASSSSSSFTLSNILQKDVKSKIAIIYDGTTSKLYRGGTLISSTSGYNDLISELYIGGSKYSGTSWSGKHWKYASGYYNNIIIYNIALTQSQLKSVLGE